MLKKQKMENVSQELDMQSTSSREKEYYLYCTNINRVHYDICIKSKVFYQRRVHSIFVVNIHGNKFLMNCKRKVKLFFLSASLPVGSKLCKTGSKSLTYANCTNHSRNVDFFCQQIFFCHSLNPLNHLMLLVQELWHGPYEFRGVS
jgi:hypothetical protein